MSHKSTGAVLPGMLWKAVLSILRLVAMGLALACVGAGNVLLALGEFGLKCLKK